MNRSCEKRKPKTSHNYYNLRNAIWNCGISYVELAKKINVNKSTISKWCIGEQFPNEKNLSKLLPILNKIQAKKNLIPYSLQYLRGDNECKILENEEIYNRTYLKDETIETIYEFCKQGIESPSLIASTNPINNISIANFVISQNQFWETFSVEANKLLSKVIKEHSQDFKAKGSYDELIKYIEEKKWFIKYESEELNNIIENILKDYIKELLKFYYHEK